MIYKEEYIIAGKVLKPHGYQGNLMVKINEGFFDIIFEKEYIFLEIEGICVPFFMLLIEEAGNNKCLVKLRDYNTDTGVSEFRGCNVFLSKDKTLPSKLEDLGISSYIGYDFLDAHTNALGKVIDVNDVPGNPLLEIELKNKECYFIPFHSDLIKKTDHKKKLLIMILPDGLLIQSE